MNDQPEALLIAADLELYPASYTRDMQTARLLREQHAEIEELREANEAFGKRQEWWSEKMFQIETEVERLRQVLNSIAGNTCCDTCQEAALVAKAALKEDER